MMHLPVSGRRSADSSYTWAFPRGVEAVGDLQGEDSHIKALKAQAWAGAGEAGAEAGWGGRVGSRQEDSEDMDRSRERHSTRTRRRKRRDEETEVPATEDVSWSTRQVGGPDGPLQEASNVGKRRKPL
jgi:hypothetical protein